MSGAYQLDTTREKAAIHRSAITAVDKLADVTPVGAKNDGITGVMAASAHYYAVSPGNRYGSCVPTLGGSTITPTLNKTVDITIPQSAGAEWYDVFFSTDAQPKWLARITEAQRLVNCKVTGVGTVADSDTPGVKQVETATVVAAAGITLAGNATVVVTAAGMTGSPKTISVAVALNDTAAQVAAKIRAALAADSAVIAKFDVGGTGATVTLTSKTYAANDGTLNISVDNGTCTGLTTAASSANTTAGVLGGICNVRLIGTGVATNADPFKFNNAYKPTTPTPIDCSGYTKACIYVSASVTDLRSAPTLTVIPFLKNPVSCNWSMTAPQAITLLTANGKPMMQYVVVDVYWASNLVVLVDAITGQGTSVDVFVELIR